MHLPIAVGEGEVVGGRGGVMEGSEESSGSEGGEEEIVDVCDSVREWGEEGRFEQGQLEEGRLEGKTEGNIGGKGKEVGGSEREQGEEGHFEATVAGKGAMVQVEGGCRHGEGQQERQEGEEGRKSEESEKGKAEEGEREVEEEGEGQAEQEGEECEQGVKLLRENQPFQENVRFQERFQETKPPKCPLTLLASHNFDAAFFPSLLIVSAIASTLLAVAFAVAPLFEFTDFSTPVVLGVVTAIHLDFALLLLTISPLALLAVAFPVAPLFEFANFSTPVMLGVVTAIHLDFALLLLTILPVVLGVVTAIHLDFALLLLTIADPIASPISLHDPPSSPPLLPLLSRPQTLALEVLSSLTPSLPRSALISICADSIAPPPLSLHDPPSAAPLLPRLSRPQLWPDRGSFQPRSSMLPAHWNHPKRHAA
ncbi:unnamed protein product [Closterium sp. Naga37s-1]|nr:unnamed protein product [Closterium sp. Naga37s-1]